MAQRDVALGMARRILCVLRQTVYLTVALFTAALIVLSVRERMSLEAGFIPDSRVPSQESQQRIQPMDSEGR